MQRYAVWNDVTDDVTVSKTLSGLKKHRPTQTYTDRHRPTETNTDIHRPTETDTGLHRHTHNTDLHRQTQTYTDRQVQTQDYADRHRPTETNTDIHRPTYSYTVRHTNTHWHRDSCMPIITMVTHRECRIKWREMKDAKCSVSSAVSSAGTSDTQMWTHNKNLPRKSTGHADAISTCNNDILVNDISISISSRSISIGSTVLVAAGVVQWLSWWSLVVRLSVRLRRYDHWRRQEEHLIKTVVSSQ